MPKGSCVRARVRIRAVVATRMSSSRTNDRANARAHEHLRDSRRKEDCEYKHERPRSNSIERTHAQSCARVHVHTNIRACLRTNPYAQEREHRCNHVHTQRRAGMHRGDHANTHAIIRMKAGVNVLRACVLVRVRYDGTLQYSSNKDVKNAQVYCV